MAPKSVTFRRHDHLVSVLFGDLLSHSYNITFSMFLDLCIQVFQGKKSWNSCIPQCVWLERNVCGSITHTRQSLYKDCYQNSCVLQQVVLPVSKWWKQPSYILWYFTTKFYQRNSLCFTNTHSYSLPRSWPGAAGCGHQCRAL